MRNKSRIQALETRIEEMTEQVTMLLEVMTKPEKASQLEPAEFFANGRKGRKAVRTKNRFKAWTKDDVSSAIALRDKGLSNEEIGKVLGRSDQAVRSMFFRYGLS